MRNVLQIFMPQCIRLVVASTVQRGPLWLHAGSYLRDHNLYIRWRDYIPGYVGFRLIASQGRERN